MVIENTKNNFFTLSKKGHQLTNTSPTLVSSFNHGHHIIELCFNGGAFGNKVSGAV
jgi:hypothetical protein